MTPYLNVDDLVALRNRLTECQHDPTFRADNEANGGAGCPRCNQKRVVMVQHADGEMEVEPCWIVNPVVTMEQPETIALMEQTRILYDAAQDWQYIVGDLAL